MKPKDLVGYPKHYKTSLMLIAIIVIMEVQHLHDNLSIYIIDMRFIEKLMI